MTAYTSHSGFLSSLASAGHSTDANSSRAYRVTGDLCLERALGAHDWKLRQPLHLFADGASLSADASRGHIFRRSSVERHDKCRRSFLFGCDGRAFPGLYDQQPSPIHALYGISFASSLAPFGYGGLYRMHGSSGRRKSVYPARRIFPLTVYDSQQGRRILHSRPSAERSR